MRSPKLGPERRDRRAACRLASPTITFRVRRRALQQTRRRVRNMRGTASARRQVKFEELESTSSEAGVNRRSSALCHHDGHTYSVGWSAVLSPLGGLCTCSASEHARRSVGSVGGSMQEENQVNSVASKLGGRTRRGRTTRGLGQGSCGAFRSKRNTQESDWFVWQVAPIHSQDDRRHDSVRSRHCHQAEECKELVAAALRKTASG